MRASRIIASDRWQTKGPVMLHLSGTRRDTTVPLWIGDRFVKPELTRITPEEMGRFQIVDFSRLPAPKIPHDLGRRLEVSDLELTSEIVFHLSPQDMLFFYEAGDWGHPVGKKSVINHFGRESLFDSHDYLIGRDQ